MQSKKTLDKMRENIINGTSNFIGIKDTYCDCQDACKIVATVSAQYNAVVKQNQSLQKTVLWQQDQMQKDNDYLIKLEEANMLLEQDVEVQKRQIDALKEELEKYKRAVNKVNSLSVKEILK